MSDLTDCRVVEPVDADGCGAQGCRGVHPDLYHVSLRGVGDRVLCREHAEDLLQREVRTR
jgi:hypothetical protein